MSCYECNNCQLDTDGVSWCHIGFRVIDNQGEGDSTPCESFRGQKTEVTSDQEDTLPF